MPNTLRSWSSRSAVPQCLHLGLSFGSSAIAASADRAVSERPSYPQRDRERGGESRRTRCPKLPLLPRVLEPLELELLLELALPRALRVVLLALEQEAAARVLERREVVLDVLADAARERREVGGAIGPLKVLDGRAGGGRAGCRAGEGRLEGVVRAADALGGGGCGVARGGSGGRGRVGGEDLEGPLAEGVGLLLGEGVLSLEALTLLQLGLGCGGGRGGGVSPRASDDADEDEGRGGAPLRRFSWSVRTCSGVRSSPVGKPAGGGVAMGATRGGVSGAEPRASRRQRRPAPRPTLTSSSSRRLAPSRCHVLFHSLAQQASRQRRHLSERPARPRSLQHGVRLLGPPSPALQLLLRVHRRPADEGETYVSRE
mgnify:CR=1 FL=1